MRGVLFCFGLGYVARHLAARLASQGFEVRGTVRDAGAVRALEALGYRVFPFSRTRPLADPVSALAGVSHILHAIPPDEQGDIVHDLHHADIARVPTLRWLGWLGTTAVYGDRGGGWVSEEDEPRPTLERARRRLAAEAAWLGSGLPVHIFRLSGIYGPGRNPIRNLLDGRAHRIRKPGQVFSRIHIDDLVTVLEASMRRPQPGRIYNVADDEPAPPQEVVAYAAQLLGVPPPPEIPYETAVLTPAQRSFYRDNRRVRNARIKRELGVTLKYPSYREGLRALLEVEVGSAA